MRIHTHTAVAIEPIRSAPVTRQPSSTSSTPSAVKPTFLSPAPTTSSDPFSTLFQALSGSTAGSSKSTPVTATSIFGPSASINAAANATAATTAAATGATLPATGTSATTATAPGVAIQPPGIEALVGAIMNGSFKPTYVTDPSQLQETTPAGTDTMPNFYYASDATANQLASLLGGTVVQKPAFGQDQGWNEPLANFIQLPNGQTFNAADVAYYANTGSVGSSQLTADITQTINQGSAWSNYYLNGGNLPTFPMGYVGPPISGMAYPANMIGADGNVVNPSMQTTNSNSNT